MWAIYEGVDKLCLTVAGLNPQLIENFFVL